MPSAATVEIELLCFESCLAFEDYEYIYNDDVIFSKFSEL